MSLPSLRRLPSNLGDLLSAIDVEPVAPDLFRSGHSEGGSSRAFGGTLLAQALSAACHTVEDRAANSLHAYFVRPGRSDIPVLYRVDRLRDGKSFSLRQVHALQDDQLVLSVLCSFHSGEPGEEHQPQMPSVPAPDELIDQLGAAQSQGETLPFVVRRLLRPKQPFEFRLVDLEGMVTRQLRGDVRHFWLRAKETVPGSAVVHQALLTYVSDVALIDVALHRHGFALFDGRHQASSIDHALWFHRPFRVDEWLLYSQESPTTAAGRGFVRGSLFAANGDLVASVTQEGLLRRAAQSPS